MDDLGAFLAGLQLKDPTKVASALDDIGISSSAEWTTGLAI